jgi:uncharacterized protein
MDRTCVLCLFLLIAACTSASASSLLLPRYADDDLALMETAAYLASHPDYRWRIQGLATLADGDAATAVEQLRTAASHADKAAQAVLGELYWHGRGVAVDRVEGYAFMALAAERQYPRYLALRDRYGKELTDAERVAATQRHAALLAAYGDAVAKPRLEAALRAPRARRDGSRSYARFSARPLQGGLPGMGMSGASGIDRRDWQAAKYWQAAAYWAWQDALYGTMRPPRVRIIELKPMVRSHAPRRALLSEDR